MTRLFGTHGARLIVVLAILFVGMLVTIMRDRSARQTEKERVPPTSTPTEISYRVPRPWGIQWHGALCFCREHTQGTLL
jgi:hypothetical protein